MTTAIALLRAVNVPGRTAKKDDLLALAEEAGLKGTRTLLQTGNLVFETARAPDAVLEAELEAAAKARFGFDIDFIVRTANEWAALVEANPFPRAAKADPARLLAAPLKTEPDADGLPGLMTLAKGHEEAALVGRCAYIFYPEGIGRSRLGIQAIERHLATRGTGRNWNTVLKLAAMVA